jgi:hypothetical protein
MHRAAAELCITPAEHRRLNELLKPLVPDLTGVLPD